MLYACAAKFLIWREILKKFFLCWDELNKALKTKKLLICSFFSFLWLYEQ